MKPSLFISSLLSLALLVLTGPAGAQDCTEVEGSDHPSLPRYEGACLIAHVTKAYDQLELPTGPVVQRSGNWLADDHEALEGRSTRLMYLIPHGRSSLEVFRNYERALNEGGFEILFSCAGNACGGRNGVGMIRHLYPAERRIGQPGQHAYSAFGSGKDLRYLAARSGDGRLFVGILMDENKHIFLRQNPERVAVHVDVMAMAEMEVRMIDAAAMAKSIGETGSVRLDNVYFDFGTAQLSAESTVAIAEMAKLLRDNPGLDIYVVGHTDAVGAYEANLELSRRRAEAVVAALRSSHGIVAGRMVAAGVGPLAPLASNATEQGRTQNRRVELVAR